MVTAEAPASCTIRASSGALRARSFHPARIFTVTGIVTALAIALMTAAACSGSRIRLQPALCFAIFGTGQPMFTSTMSAPMASTIRAASAIRPGSPPKIWIETGRSSSVYSAYSSVRSMPRTSPSELTISVTTRPQPPWRLTRRRNAESVMPAIGAMAKGEGSLTEPICIRQLSILTGDATCTAMGTADRLHGAWHAYRKGSDELHTMFCAVDAHGSRATRGVESGHGKRRTRSIGARQAYLRRSADAARRREAPRDHRWGALRDAVPVHEASNGLDESDEDIRPIPRPPSDRVPVGGPDGCRVLGFRRRGARPPLR